MKYIIYDNKSELLFIIQMYVELVKSINKDLEVISMNKYRKTNVHKKAMSICLWLI